MTHSGAQELHSAPVCFLYAKARQVDHLNQTEKIKVAVIGPGNIGSDLMYKIMRSPYLEMALMTGIVESEGIRRAAGFGIPVSTEGVAETRTTGKLAMRARTTAMSRAL